MVCSVAWGQIPPAGKNAQGSFIGGNQPTEALVQNYLKDYQTRYVLPAQSYLKKEMSIYVFVQTAIAAAATCYHDENAIIGAFSQNPTEKGILHVMGVRAITNSMLYRNMGFMLDRQDYLAYAGQLEQMGFACLQGKVPAVPPAPKVEEPKTEPPATETPK